MSMFTESQIKAAHSKVKSGADFPAYFQDLKNSGVTYYETFLKDGHSRYHGKSNFELTTAPKFEAISIADDVNVDQLKTDIANHQQGRSNYLEIIGQAAGNGVEKWAVCMTAMTCSYFDKSGNKILVEEIPVPKGEYA